MGEKQGLLYWIHDIRMDDIYSQGYVGITMVGFLHRLKQHRATARKGGYPEKFCKGLLSDTLIAETILTGDSAHIRSMERHFRPRNNIGWNRAIGGDGGSVFKHGLTGSRIKACYYNMLTSTGKQGITVCEKWSGEGGLERFAEDMLPIPDGRELARLDLSLPYCKENCAWLSRSEILRNIGDIEWNGKLYSYVELAEMAGESANTLQYRLYRGWTVDEALNIVPRKKRLVKDFYGEFVQYNGKLTDEEIEELIELRSTGATTTAIGAAFDIDAGQVSRLCSRFRVTNA